MVTQILLYLAISCFLTKQQIRAFQLIINELRFIRCVSLLPVFLIITHSLRHTYVTSLMERHVPIEEIAQLMGHVDPTTTAIYLKSSLNLLKECTLNIDNL